MFLFNEMYDEIKCILFNLNLLQRTVVKLGDGSALVNEVHNDLLRLVSVHTRSPWLV